MNETLDWLKERVNTIEGRLENQIEALKRDNAKLQEHVEALIESIGDLRFKHHEMWAEQEKQGRASFKLLERVEASENRIEALRGIGLVEREQSRRRNAKLVERVEALENQGLPDGYEVVIEETPTESAYRHIAERPMI